MSFVLLVVTGHGREAKWTKVESPFFTIYSEASDAETRDWAAELEQFRRAMRELLQVTPSQLPPATVVIFHDRRDLSAYLPQRDGRPLDLAGYTGQSKIGTTISLSAGGWAESSRAAIFFGATNWFLSGLDTPGPFWLSIGLGEVFSTFEVKGDEFTFGLNKRAYVDRIAHGKGMSLDQLFKLDGKDLPYQHDDLTSSFHAQAWALTHYLLFGRGSAGAAGLGNYLSLLQTTDVDSAFKRALAATPREMENRLRDYMRGGHYYATKGKFARAEIDHGLKFSSATPAEVLIAKGYLLLMNGNFAGARTHFDEARSLAPTEPKVPEAMGDMAMVSGDERVARRHFEEAVAAGSRSYHVYLSLAYFLAPDLAFAVTEIDSSATASSIVARRAANYLEQAINLNPYHARIFERLAVALARVDHPLPEDAEFLELGLQLLPGDAVIGAGLASLDAKRGHGPEARRRVDALIADGREQAAWVGAFVRLIDLQVRQNDDLVRVEVLLTDGHAADAAQLIEKLLAADPSASVRVRLGRLQRAADEIQLLDRAEDLLKHGDAAGARLLAKPLSDSDSSPVVPRRARELLEKLDAAAAPGS